MSVCSAAEIAEKKRIALERLKARQQVLTNVAEKVAKPSINPSPSPGNRSADIPRVMQERSKTSHRTLQQGRISAQPYPKQSPFKSKPNAGQNQQAQDIVQLKPYVPNNIRIVTCRLAMMSHDRFALHLSEYHSKVIDVSKTIQTRSYDPANRVWSFHVKDYDMVLERIGALKPHVVLEKIPKNIMQMCTTESGDQIDLSYLSPITESLVDSLLPFQKEGVCFGISKQGRILIADEMGLGKTYQALALVDFYKEDFPLLIATTASTRSAWVSHIYKLLPYIACQHVVSVASSSDFFFEAKVVICSYPMMEKCLDKLGAMNFGILIMDESHTLKNSKANCTKVATKLAKKAKRVILLSGTPALSRPAELYSQLKMLDQKFLSFIEYTTRYCDGKPSTFGWDSSGQSNLDELNLILSKKYMIRRIKADVLPQLAEKNRETVYLDPALVQINTAVTNFNLNLSQSYGRMKEEVLLQFYAETARVKCTAVCSYLKSIVKEKIKFIVFAHHKILMNAICESLKMSKTKHVRIDGGTKNDLRTQRVEKFQKDESCQVAVLSLKACNTGITLTAAKLILFAELDWNPSTLAQAESRAHRIGQDSTVTCRYLMARNTADDIIWKMLKSKQDVLNKAGLCCENLQDSEHIAGPNSSGNIEKYVVKTPRKNDNQNQPAVSPTGIQNRQQTNRNHTPKSAAKSSDGNIQNFLVKTPRKNELPNTTATKDLSETDALAFDDAVRDLLNDNDDFDLNF